MGRSGPGVIFGVPVGVAERTGLPVSVPDLADAVSSIELCVDIVQKYHKKVFAGSQSEYM